MGLLGSIHAGWNSVSSGLGVALQALWAHKLRAVLTALGIVIGVATVIGILSIIHGLDASFERQMNTLGIRTFYVDQFPWMRHHAWFEYRNRPPIREWQYRRLKELLPFAEAVVPIESEGGRVERGDDQVNDVRVTGTSDEYTKLGTVDVERGRFLSATDVEHERAYAVLGSELAAKLFENVDPLLQHVLIRGKQYLVIGVLKSQGTFFGQSRDNVAFVPINCFRRDFGSEHSMNIGVKVRADIDLDEAREELRGYVRRVRGLRPKEEDDFAINEQKMISDMYGNLTGTLYLVIIGVSLISLLVGGIGIMNIMMVSVTERTREIGIRKAIGAKNRAVLFQFLVESVVLSLLGGVLGIGLGILAASLVELLSPLPAAPSVFAVMLGLGFAVVVGVFFGFYPASRAARLDPIVCLRQE